MPNRISLTVSYLTLCTTLSKWAGYSLMGLNGIMQRCTPSPPPSVGYLGIGTGGCRYDQRFLVQRGQQLRPDKVEFKHVRMM